MVSPEGIKSFESRQSVWEGIREEPAKVPDSPWAPVLKKAVAKEPDQRHNSAHTLIRELEDVTLRVEGADEVTPYPGLAFFTEADAEYFYGREAEVEGMWRTLEQPHLLAIIGPSGSGKSSFLRAGLIPARPEGWSCVVATPGSSPLVGLAQALVPEFAGDAEAIRDLVRTDDPDAMASAVARWRERHDQVVLVVDQFEELFTLNPPDVQSRYADLLGRLALENDVHILLSMRDDFLFHCQAHQALRPVFSEITPLGPLVGGALRRALVQPASRCGYRFDDDDLVVEMLGEVEGERGSLPLLAFAVSRLWEERDRGEGLLTREAYQRIGGVGGALGKHAEDTLERIGEDREPMVREIFRNLITAQSTRAVRDLDNLLSVFDQHERGAANDVLRELVDARLLTTFDTGGEDEEPRRRVEIIHESLLANWPRLVRWQTQDADAAQLRDQLRQAARTWDEHDRTKDYLWTGGAYREFTVWQEGYPGGLSEIEEQFAHAMTAHARHRKRHRRIAVAAAFLGLLTVLGVVGVSRQQAIAEANRAEAAKLLALGQVHLEDDPTEALCFAAASLELADTEEARIFALRALWAGPPALILEMDAPRGGGGYPIPTFSPDGRWLAVAGLVNGKVLLYPESGKGPIVLGGHSTSTSGAIQVGWSQHSQLVTGHWTEGRARVWSMPKAELVREIDFGGNAVWQVGGSHLFAEVVETEPKTGAEIHRLRSWELPHGHMEELGKIDREELGLGELVLRVLGSSDSVFDPVGKKWLYARGNTVFSREMPTRSGSPDVLLVRYSSLDAWISHWRRPQGLFSSNGGGEVVLWTSPEWTAKPGRRPRSPETATTRLLPDPSGRWALEEVFSGDGRARIWDLDGLGRERPWSLKRSGSWYFSHIDFHPDGKWVAATTNNQSEVTFWPLPARLPAVMDGYDTSAYRPVRFTSDGLHLVTPWGQDRVRLWPLPGAESADVVDVVFPHEATLVMGLAVGPNGEHALTMGYGEDVFLLSLKGGPARHFPAASDMGMVAAGEFSPSGRLVAIASYALEEKPAMRVWDLATDEVRVFDLPRTREESVSDSRARYLVSRLDFIDETTIVTSGGNGLHRWNIETGDREEIEGVESGGHQVFHRVSGNRRSMVTTQVKKRLSTEYVDLQDLRTGEVQRLHPPLPTVRVALSYDSKLWAGTTRNGFVWVGRTFGSEAYLLAGHEGAVGRVAISPDNQWIASSGEDNTLRIWPMPDLSKPPLHTLPHDELIAKLKTLTNLRVVRDEESSTGWKVEVGPFPGWETVPEW